MTEDTIDPSVKESKKWTSYFLEFLMLFLAVSLGFLADNYREKLSENAKEKEYIRSMIEDAETDQVNIKNAIASNLVRINHLDSLAVLCMKPELPKNIGPYLYKHYRYGLIHPDFITPTERTLQQLKNAGGMRLIRHKKAADIIIQYNGNTDKLKNQQAFYERYQNRSIDIAMKVFDFQKFGFNNLSPSMKDESAAEYYRLKTTDKNTISEFGNVVIMYQGVARYYSQLLHDMDIQADTLKQVLRDAYQMN